jgi:hypothetical protein
MKKKYDGGRKRRDLIKLGRCLTNANEGNDVVRKIEGGKEKHRAPFFFIAVLKQHGKLFLVVHVSTQGVKKGKMQISNHGSTKWKPI